MRRPAGLVPTTAGFGRGDDRQPVGLGGSAVVLLLFDRRPYAGGKRKTGRRPRARRRSGAAGGWPALGLGGQMRP